MGRYQFIEEDDQNDDHDEEWRNPQHRSHPSSSMSSRERIHATIRHSNSYGSREEGEIVEENDDGPNYNQYGNCNHHQNDASDHSYCGMDIDDNDNDEYHSDDPYHRGSFSNDPSPRSQQYDIDGYDDVDNHNDDEEEEDRNRHHQRRPLSSYLPSFSGLTSNVRNHRSYGGRRRNPSPESEGPAHQNPNRNHYRNKENLVNEAGHEHHHNDGKEYRLIGSSRYDRSYDREDFYHPPPASSTDRDESHHAVSEDEREREYHLHSGTPSMTTTTTAAAAMVTRSQNNNRQLSSSSSSTAPEIHYHIYVSEDQAARWFPSGEGERDAATNDGASPRKSSQSQSQSNSYGYLPLWKKLTFLACITQLLWMLVASRMAPPPPYLTWDEYGKHQWKLARRVSSEGYALGRHLLRTAALRGGECDDNDNGLDTTNNPIYRFPDTWWPASTDEPSRRHNASASDSASRGVSENVVGSAPPEAGWWLAGQDRARKHLQSRLNKWSSSLSSGSTTTPSRRGSVSRPLGARLSQQRGPSLSWSSRSPLVIYASGGKGVGKRSLAYLLLQQLETEGLSTDRKRSAWEECAEAWSHRAARTRTHHAEEDDLEQGSRQHQQSPYCPLLHLTPSDYHHSEEGGLDSDYFDYESSGTTAMDTTEDDGDSEPSSPLYRKILDHVVAAGGGASIVLLERVDCASASASAGVTNSALAAFPEDCPHPPPSSSSLSSSSAATSANSNANSNSNFYSGHEEDWLLDLTAALQRRPAVFGNTIVVVTSRLGTATAEKWTRKRLQQQTYHNQQHHNNNQLPDDWLVADEVQSLVRYELRKHHSGSGEHGHEHEHESRLDNWWIVPMVPLERDAMASILDAMAASGGKDFASAIPPPLHSDHGHNQFTNVYNTNDHGFKIEEDNNHIDDNDNGNDNDTTSTTTTTVGGVMLTERASAGILDRLEWHQWIHKTTGAVLRVWSPYGAAPLRKLWNHRIQPRLASALVSGCGGAPSDSNNDGDNSGGNSDGNSDGDGERTLLLDADGGSADRWILRSCVAAAAGGEEEDSVVTTTTTDGRRWKCREDSVWNGWNEQACQFYL